MKNMLFALSLLTFTHYCLAQYDPKALDILEAMSNRYKSIPTFEANITSTLTNEVDGVHEEFKGKITVKGDKFRLQLDDQEIINNGTTVWQYIPSAKEVNIDNYDPDSEDINPTKILNAYKKGYKYLYLEENVENGVACDVVDLVPENKDAQYFKVRMNISKKDRSMLSWTMFEKNGNRFKYSITKFQPGVDVADNYFTFDTSKYPGVEVIDLR